MCGVSVEECSIFNSEFIIITCSLKWCPLFAPDKCDTVIRGKYATCMRVFHVEIAVGSCSCTYASPPCRT